MSAVPFAALCRTEEGISTTRSVAPGATACTCSRSPASSPVASHGEAEPPRLVTTSIRAAGSRNVLSKLAKSRRISVGPAFGGGTGATTVTVSPRPSIPLSNNGWMPYATRYCCGEKQGPAWQYKGAPDLATVGALGEPDEDPQALISKDAIETRTRGRMRPLLRRVDRCTVTSHRTWMLFRSLCDGSRVRGRRSPRARLERSRPGASMAQAVCWRKRSARSRSPSR